MVALILISHCYERMLFGDLKERLSVRIVDVCVDAFEESLRNIPIIMLE